MHRRLLTSLALRTLLAVTLTVPLLGCFSERPDEEEAGITGPPQSGLVEVKLTDALQFVPAEVRITPGTRIRWVTESIVFHTVTPRDAEQPGVWTEKDMPSGAEPFEHTFTVAGQTYDYFCVPHEAQGMLGKIMVVEN